MAVSARLQLRVAPRAASSAVVGPHGNGWKVRVAAAPEDGRANEAVVRLLASVLSRPVGDVRIVSGYASRSKVAEVAGIDLDAAQKALGRASAATPQG